LEPEGRIEQINLTTGIFRLTRKSMHPASAPQTAAIEKMPPDDPGAKSPLRKS
jgi:hypothetical protein